MQRLISGYLVWNGPKRERIGEDDGVGQQGDQLSLPI